jgi:trk system potassium uptake protein TrkH
MGLKMQHISQSETKRLRMGEIRRVVLGVIKLALAVEAITAAMLAVRYFIGYDASVPEALRFGVFHAIAAFNNAGFGLFNDNLAPFAGDPFILGPIITAFILGGLGFPVVFELGRHISRTWTKRRGGFSMQHWTLHTKVTLLAYAALSGVGIVAVTVLEWANPRTFGPMGVLDKLYSGTLHGLSPRTAGFQTVDIGALEPVTLLVYDVLMFIGGGSAGTAGGIKVTTFALLGFVILAEIRGQPTVHVLGRKLSDSVQRQAVAVALLGIAAVIAGTTVLLMLTDFELDKVLFEVISAFGTVGLSTGITAELPTAGHFLLIALMFVGRLGPITLASALALRDRVRRFDLPEERPLVG